MKHINKNISNEPSAFREYRNTLNATYSGYTDKDIRTGEARVLKKALADEQGWICCYCMQKLQDGNITVEHYVTQHKHKTSPLSEKDHKDNQLNYMNLLASCNYADRNCSGERGNSILRKLDPRRAESSEQLLAYDLADGEIKSTLIDANVIHDLNVVLKLNSIPLKRARKIAMDSAFDKLKKIKKLQNRTWTKTDIDKIINEYRTKFRDENNNLAYRAYCMAAIYVLENKKLHRP